MRTIIYLKKGTRRAFLDGAILQGLGIPDINYKTSRAPFQDGETYVSQQVDPRVLQVGIPSTLYVQQLRENLMSFVSVGDTLTLGMIHPTLGHIMLPSVYLDAELEFVFSDQALQGRRAYGLRFLAYDPCWYSTTETIIVSATQGDQLVFPITFPITFDSEDTISSVISCSVGGTFDVPPTIVFRGPMSYPQVRNLTTGLKLSLNCAIVSGEEITFSNASVVDNAGLDRRAQLTIDSRLDLYLQAATTNALHVFAANCNTLESKVTVSWRDRYLFV